MSQAPGVGWLEWTERFVCLPADKTVSEARTLLGRQHTYRIVVVSRARDLQYVYLRSEIEALLRAKPQDLKLTSVLELHEDRRSIELNGEDKSAPLPSHRPEAPTAARFFVQDKATGHARVVGVPVTYPIGYFDGTASSSTPAKSERRVRSAVRRRDTLGTSRTRTGAAAPTDVRAEVSTGFAAADAPADVLSTARPLNKDTDYVFWFTVGKPRDGAIDRVRTTTPVVPVGTRLRVILFSVPGGFAVSPESDEGEIEVVDRAGTARVIREPSPLLASRARPDVRQSVLLFPVRAPSHSGTHRLRCGIYHGQTLLQSRVVSAHVETQPTKGPALVTDVDFAISHTFDPGHLVRIPSYNLSVIANESGKTHDFYFVGTKFREPAHFEADALRKLLEQGRKALRQVTWGDEQEFVGSPERYRYRMARARADVLKDLIVLAEAGMSIYNKVIDEFAGMRPMDVELREAMRWPGLVQIAMMVPQGSLPVALMYDKPMRQQDPDKYAVCSDFLASLDDPTVCLENTPCFLGHCPSWDDRQVMCPSGFWGYRQNLGMPVHIKNAPDAPEELTCSGSLQITGGVSTSFKQLEPHLARLRTDTGMEWRLASSREETLRLFHAIDPQIVYFFCHGGVKNDTAYIHVGDENEDWFTIKDLRDENRLWTKSRPLVFINGCETTAVDPSQLLDMIKGFVQVMHAGGVVGTEITIFESLATAFAEECLGRFIAGTPIGEAVRFARLALLKTGNPLGLVYVPFCMPSLRLVPCN